MFRQHNAENNISNNCKGFFPQTANEESLVNILILGKWFRVVTNFSVVNSSLNVQFLY